MTLLIPAKNMFAGFLSIILALSALFISVTYFACVHATVITWTVCPRLAAHVRCDQVAEVCQFCTSEKLCSKHDAANTRLTQVQAAPVQCDQVSAACQLCTSEKLCRKHDVANTSLVQEQAEQTIQATSQLVAQQTWPEFGPYSYNYDGLSESRGDDIISNFFSNIGLLIGRYAPFAIETAPIFIAIGAMLAWPTNPQIKT